MTFTKLIGGVALASATVFAAAAAPVNIGSGQAAAGAHVAVPATTLLSYAGTYRTDRGMEATIALNLHGALTIQLNSPPLRLRPVSQTEFAVDGKRARVIFHADNGKVSGFTVRMGSRELHATRVS